MGIMKRIEAYYYNKFTQQDLEKRYKSQSFVCECGYPALSQNVIIREGFFKVERIYREIDYTCNKCSRVFKVVG